MEASEGENEAALKGVDLELCVDAAEHCGVDGIMSGSGGQWWACCCRGSLVVYVEQFVVAVVVVFPQDGSDSGGRVVGFQSTLDCWEGV